jgi:succinyl-CoA synthetase alpha subunit
MSILVDKQTRLLVQNITGHDALFHTQQMVAYGTNVVAGVTPGKGGEWVLDGKIPVLDSVKIAIDATGANASVNFVPARFAADALCEAADAGLKLVVCITEGIPVQDMMRARNYMDQKGVRLVGPNCPGLLTTGECKVGIIPGDIAIPGNVGVVSRSGTLTYEVLFALKLQGMGVSTCVGIGGDPINGTNFIDCLSMFEDDPHTERWYSRRNWRTDEEQLNSSQIMTKPGEFYRRANCAARKHNAGAIVEGFWSGNRQDQSPGSQR